MRFSPPIVFVGVLGVFCALPVSNAEAANRRAKPQAITAEKVARLPERAANDAENTDTANALAAAKINQDLVHLSFNWGRASVHRGPHELSLGHWGQSAPDLFAGSQTAADEARLFASYKTGALVLQYTALAAYVADLVFIIARAKENAFTGKDDGIFYGLLGGGLVLSIVGANMQNAAYTHLGRAIVAENESVVNRVLGVQAQASLFVAPLPSGVGAGAMVRW